MKCPQSWSMFNEDSSLEKTVSNSRKDLSPKDILFELLTKNELATQVSKQTSANKSVRLVENITVCQNVYSSVFLLQFLLWHEQGMHDTLWVFTIKSGLQKHKKMVLQTNILKKSTPEKYNIEGSAAGSIFFHLRSFKDYLSYGLPCHLPLILRKIVDISALFLLYGCMLHSQNVSARVKTPKPKKISE